jgi:hypothetical protein
VYIDDFIRLPDIIDKLEHKHRVLPEEVEEVFFNHPRYRFLEKGHVMGEDLYVARADRQRALLECVLHTQAR